MAMVNLTADDQNWHIGVIPMAEGESWFTQGRPVIPAAIPIEALPKQPWDSYKPDFWWGILAVQQQKIPMLPYYWEGEWLHPAPVNYSFFTPTNQVAPVNPQTLNMGAPHSGVFTGRSSANNPAATT